MGGQEDSSERVKNGPVYSKEPELSVVKKGLV
jgi:hypothetical protein